MALDLTQDYAATIKKAKGGIVIRLDTKNSPQTVNNFIYLATQHYYDGTYFWRAEVPGKPSLLDPSGPPSELSLIQGGSVQDDGDAGKDYPGYTIPDELATARSGGYKTDIIAMANKGEADTGAVLHQHWRQYRLLPPCLHCLWAGNVGAGCGKADRVERQDRVGDYQRDGPDYSDPIRNAQGIVGFTYSSFFWRGRNAIEAFRPDAGVKWLSLQREPERHLP